MSWRCRGCGRFVPWEDAEHLSAWHYEGVYATTNLTETGTDARYHPSATDGAVPCGPLTWTRWRRSR